MKFFQEKAEKLGLKLFIEDSSFVPEPGQYEVYSETKFVESADGKRQSCYGVVRSAPISKFTENLNGRLYNRELWEFVVGSGAAEGSYCFAGHPPDAEEDDPRRLIGIWHNLRVLEAVVVADLHVLNNELGRTFFMALENKGKNGLSTVGYGEFLSDGKTINPKTFILERASDWVVQPSQQVYATLENVIGKPAMLESAKSVEEVSTKQSTLKEERKTVIMTDIMSKIGEANLKNIVKAHLKEAKSAIDTKDIIKMQEKIKDLKEQATIVPLEEEKAKIQAMLDKLEEAQEVEASNMKDEHSNMKDKLDQNEKELKDTKELAESLQKKLRKASEIIEKLGGTAETPEQLKVVEAMQDDIEKFAEDRKNMQADLNILVQERADMLADIEIFKEERVAMKSDIDILMKERADMLSDISIFKEERVVMQGDIKALVEDINARDTDIKNLLEDRVTMLEDINKLVIDRKNMKADIKTLKEKVKKVAASKLSETELDDLGPFPFQDQPVDEKIAVPLTSESESIIPDPAIRRRATNNATPDQLESLEKPRGSKLEESGNAESAVIKRAIVAFYESKVKEFPSLSRAKDAILGASSLNEAVDIYETQVKNNDPVIKIQESSKGKKPSWIAGYR